jgi:hypothetical protein
MKARSFRGLPSLCQGRERGDLNLVWNSESLFSEILQLLETFSLYMCMHAECLQHLVNELCKTVPTEGV